MNLDLLKGVRVVESSAFIAAPLAGMTMAQFGADVIRIDLSRETDRFEARDAIASFVEPWCRARTLEQIRAAFAEHGVCWGPYQTVREALARDPRLSEANPIFSRVDTAGVGRHLAAGAAVREMCHERGPTQPAPVLGQHTDEVLMNVLGLDAATVGALHDRGVVAGAAT